MIVDDLKFGWRQLIKAPGFTIMAILTLQLDRLATMGAMWPVRDRR